MTLDMNKAADLASEYLAGMSRMPNWNGTDRHFTVITPSTTW
jgi:hypothetical protein